MNKNRYIFDALYGAIKLPNFIWDVLSTPELQRLREIRLCNINSLCLTGGANVNRFEHAIGTCYLALKCQESWLLKKSITENEKRSFLIAALFHDVANAAFGHSIEDIEGYKPESSFFEIISGRQGDEFISKKTRAESIFFGLTGTLYEVLTKKLKLSQHELNAVSDSIQGKGAFGPLISNHIDLDNLDNVYRLAYHIGLIKERETPIKIAQALTVENRELVIEKESIPLLNNWFKTRKLLYNFLLLNPDEFSGKAMLTEAIENAKERSMLPFRWFDTDYELLKKISHVSAENAALVPRLMTGDLYGCGCILSASSQGYCYLNEVEKKRNLEKELEKLLRENHSSLRSVLVSIHAILDKNKTERKIRIKSSTHEYVEIGSASDRLLIGIFFKNKDLNMNSIQQKIKRLTLVQNDIQIFFESKLNDTDIRQLTLFHEVEDLS